MNNYTFDIRVSEDEILRHTVTAASRFMAEMILSEEYPAASINLVDVN